MIDDEPDPALVLLASQSGMALDLLECLRQRLLADAGELPVDIPGWADWIIDWLVADADARRDLLSDSRRAVNGATGRQREAILDAGAVEGMRAALRGWLEGTPLNALEALLGGAPNSATPSRRILPRARDLVGAVIPRGLSFVAGVVGRMAQELGLPEEQPNLDETMLASLSAALRRGFDTVAKLEFASSHRELTGRVETHIAYQGSLNDLVAGFDDDNQ